MPTAPPPSESDPGRPGIGVNPIFSREPVEIPRFRLPDDGLDPDAVALPEDLVSG